MQKTLVLLFLFILSMSSFSKETKKEPCKKVKTIGFFDTKEAKSGYLINDYYVELTQSQVEAYSGKKVKVTGKLSVVEGLDPNSKVIVQGASEDRKFILDPHIKILKH